MGAVAETRCLGLALMVGAGLTSASVLSCRYFYRACHSTLFPNPVQVGRQLDKLSADTRRNILSLSRVKMGSWLSPRQPSLPVGKPQNCTQKDQRGTEAPAKRAGAESVQQGPAHPPDPHSSSLKELGAKNDPLLSEELQPASTKDPSDPSWVPSTQMDRVQLNLPPSRAPPCVTYVRSSETTLSCEQTPPCSRGTTAEAELYTAV